jgi:hypothetical protein
MVTREGRKVVSGADAGWPDVHVSKWRRKGREARREFNATGKVSESNECPYSGDWRAEWWLGWYDVQLERFYRKSKQP